MRDLLIWLALGLLVLTALAIPIWLPRYRRWLDARKFYRADPFPAVKIEEDK